MLALFRRLLTGQPLSYADRWLAAQPPLSLEWRIAHKEDK
jgi:hypothetical protein